MQYSGVVKELSDRTGMSMQDTRMFLEELAAIVAHGLERDGLFRLQNIGRFYVQRRRMSYNFRPAMQCGRERHLVPVVRFAPSETLKTAAHRARQAVEPEEDSPEESRE